MSHTKIAPLIVFAAAIFTLSTRAQDMGHVIMPGADLMIQVKLADISKAPIFIAMKKWKEEQEVKAPEDRVAGVEETDKAMAELRMVTGLEPADFLLFVATVNLDGVDWDDTPEMGGVDALAAVKLGKELPVSKLETGLKASFAKKAEEKETPAGTVSRYSYDDTVILQVKEPDDDVPTCLAMTSDDKVLLVGSKSAIEGALDRYASGSKISPSTLFPASVGKAVGRGSCYMLLNPTADMMTRMGKQEDGAPNPAKDLLTKLKSIGLGINFGESLDLALIGQFTTDEAARQASMMVDAQAVSGLKMMLSMMTGGAPLPMLQTMKAGAGQIGMAWFKMSLSQADLDVLAQVAEKKTREAPVAEENMQWEEE
ncbi:MAG: hypothetical protein RRC34_10065 [Lentisphaeria bacterium]|nr:hypothetical protein [Lentisphaeria bacterium]